MNDAILRRHGLRATAILLYATSLTASRLGWDDQSLAYFLGSLVGLTLPILVAAVWGERTRPRFNLAWILLGGLLLAAIASTFNTEVDPLYLRIIPMSILVGSYIVHDHQLGPSTMILTAIFAAIVHPEFDWSQEEEGRAWAIGWAAFFGLAAAAVERERLQSKTAPATPWPWMAVRLGFVLLWTLTILTYKEDLQVGQLFANLGIDPRGENGRWGLFSLMLVFTVLAALLFKGKKQKTPKQT